MNSSQQQKWDAIYQQKTRERRPQPADVLLAYANLLPHQGLAVDLACGRGSNALFLAEKGLQTIAWDLSSVAVSELNRVAQADNLNVLAEVVDLESVNWSEWSFDVVVISRFLDREINQTVVNAIRPGGLLYYQTFVQDKDPAVGPRNAEYLLAENELLSMFPGLVLRAYCEAGRIGDLSSGLRNEAFYVGQKSDAGV